MKDYTKYDFAAIVGAEVEIHYHAGEPLIVKLIHFNDETKLLVCIVLAKNAYDMPVGRIDYTHVSEIASINAQIKVEDMSVKQLKRFAKQEVGDDKGARIGMGVNVNVFYIQANWDESQGYLFDKEHGLTDYIDCTDWGWEHE